MGFDMDMENKAMYSGLDQADYFGSSFAENANQIRNQQMLEKEHFGKKRWNSEMEDQLLKKQMSFKGGKVIQIITDSPVNNNKIFANRYQGLIGIWYFIIDSIIHFENLLAVLLAIMIYFSEMYNQIDIYFPIIALFVNVSLMCIRNLTFEFRQRKVTNKINNKTYQHLMISRKFCRFMPIRQADLKPGYILRLFSGQEFPADCLILDIQGGVAGQKCFVTSGPFDDTTGIVQKKSYFATQNKTGSRQNEQNLAEMISGLVKFEYNYFGYVQGSFKLSENPAAFEFDHENVAQRGQILMQTPMVLGLVLNVGDQCISSVYKDPYLSLKSSTNLKFRSMVKVQRSFDKAYKYTIRVFLLSLAILYMVFAGLAIYLASNDKLFHVQNFEYFIMPQIQIDYLYYILKGFGFFSILMSSIPLSFSNIIDLLVLTHTNFAEWDINLQQANIEFIHPHATLAFGKVAHMFFSRQALCRDDKLSVKLFHVVGHFFLNKTSQQDWQKIQQEQNDFSFSDSEEETSSNEFELYNEDHSLEYLPNELKFSTKFINEEADNILNGPASEKKQKIIEFFRGITLCHQASVSKDQSNSNFYKYVGVLHDELASLDFAQQQDFKLIQRGKKMMTVHLQRNIEKYDELGVVTTKAYMGHFMTVCAVRLQGQKEGMLYMKGSIASLKHYFLEREKDFHYLNSFEQKFIQSGVQSIVYAKRQLSIKETNDLIITINEGVHCTTESKKLDNLLYDLTSTQFEVLGILGLQKAIHMRNRVVVDDMILNGVKPWIVSKEDEQTHLTCLYSLQMFHNCAPLLLIKGGSERVVSDQIISALKSITERMSKKNQQQEEVDVNSEFDIMKASSREAAQSRTNTRSDKAKKFQQLKQKLIDAKDIMDFNDMKKWSLDKNRNVVLFTGRALIEILRDQTMIKLFMTLAYICDLMVGSEISPIQKQQLLRIARNYVGEGEYAAAIVTTPEDQFMINEADLSANFKTKDKSTDIQSVVDVTLKDFTAVSYLLFKHGNQIQMRLSKASQAFFYRSLISFLILFTYMLNSGFSGAIPYKDDYFTIFMLFLAPMEILVYAIFYQDYGYDILYRIYGHYKYNFSFTLVETEFVIIDSLQAIFDWSFIYLPFETIASGPLITTQDGKIADKDAYNCYQVILMQMTFFLYLKNTNVQIIQSITTLFFLTFLGIALIFNDEYMIAPQQLIYCPVLMMQLLFQFLVLTIRNLVASVLSLIVIKRYSNLAKFYADVEERLQYEQFEDPNQTFSIQQYSPLYQKINTSNIHNTLRLINMNMMKVTKNEAIDQILDRINTELDNDMRGHHNIAMSGEINYYTLQLIDLNKETEYQENKNSREIIYVKRQLIVFILNTMLFSILGLILSFSISYTNIGIIYYISLSVFSIAVYMILPKVTKYLSNILLFYTVIIIFCYTIYTSRSESLQPTGLIFVLALVAGLNHSFIYITMTMIIISVMMHIFFSYINEDEIKNQTGYVRHFGTIVWIFTSLVWSSYVYVQELQKKTQFVNGHKKMRSFLKLRSILNIMVPTLVREKLRSGKKNIQDEEREVSVVIIKLHKFNQILQQYQGSELMGFMDEVYNAFDFLCDEQGLQKIESIGDTYMACGGLKSAEKKIETRLLNRHHSVRVTDFSMAVLNFVQTIIQKNGQKLEIRIAVHTGPVISGIFGEVKPQFCLVGESVRKVIQMCHNTMPQQVTVSQETQTYLETYANNYAFVNIKLNFLNKQETVFYVQTLSQYQRIAKAKNFQKKVLSFNGKFMGGQTTAKGEDMSTIKDKAGFQKSSMSKKDPNKLDENGKQCYSASNITSNNEGMIMDSNSIEQSNDGAAEDSIHSNKDKDWNNQFLDNMEDQHENDSNKTDMVDDGAMNVFGFNDDLNLDDRLIIQNPTENQIYNLVERTKFLLVFEFKDTEQEFLYAISKQEALKTTIYLSQLVLLNKIVIFGDILQNGNFVPTTQFYIMFPIFALELILIYKLNNPTIQHIHFWTYLLLIYGIIVLGVLLSLQIKYLGKWVITSFTELQIQLTLSIIFMMRNVLLRQFLMTYLIYLMSWLSVIILVYIFSTENVEYQIFQFVMGQIMYVFLLVMGIHHREMIQRKSLNYERILDVEISKTNELISKLVPMHVLNIINTEEKKIDEIEKATILYIDMFGFTDMTREHTMHHVSKDYIELVSIMQKIFARFDNICESNKVYKVYTLADCYVIMGYTGKINKNQRTKGIIFEEAHRVICTALEMLEAAKEIWDSCDTHLNQLNMRVGIHTGNIVAGIIGSKLVRYDIFGEGVMIAKQIEQRGEAGQVSISESTREILQQQEDIYSEFIIKEGHQHNFKAMGRQVKTYTIQRDQSRLKDDRLNSSKYTSDMHSDQFGSKNTENDKIEYQSQRARVQDDAASERSSAQFTTKRKLNQNSSRIRQVNVDSSGSDVEGDQSYQPFSDGDNAISNGYIDKFGLPAGKKTKKI